MSTPSVPVSERFWQRTAPRGECVEWTGCRNEYGYGLVSVARRSRRAHRVSWELANGPAPAGLCVLHRCDNPPCVDPAHLFLGTPADNTADMIAKGRDYRGPRRARASRPCSVPGCGRTRHSHGLCPAHLGRLERHGTPFGDRPVGRHAQPVLTDEERFWAKVRRDGECWAWTGAAQQAWYRRRLRSSRHVAYLLILGREVGGVVRMSCERADCVNPGHMTLSENR